MNKPSNDPAPAKDFWDLGDDDLDLDIPATTASPTEETPEKTVVPEPRQEETVHQPAAPIQVIEDKPEETAETAEAPSQPEAAPAVRRRVTAQHKPTTTAEKAAIGVFFLTILGLGSWAVANYFAQAPEITLLTVTEDFPAKGNHITVEETETWWRKPIREGENADRGIQLSANLVPCARIRISGDSNGTIRYAFRDDDEQIKGDSPTLHVNNGKFEKSGSNEILVTCSGGFSDALLIHPYVEGDIMPWTLQIFEAGPGQTPDRESEPFVTALVSGSVKAPEDEESK